MAGLGYRSSVRPRSGDFSPKVGASILGLLLMALNALGSINAAGYSTGATVINVMMWAMAVLTVVSGMQYIMPNIDLIKNAK